MKNKSFGVIVASFVLLGLGLAACSSSKSHTTTPTTGGSGGGATGTPLKIATIADTDTEVGPDNLNGLKIGIAAVNAAGGVNGHPLELSQCTEPGDANQATTCARNDVSDSSVLAVVGTGTTYGDNVDPLFTAAGLASVGNSDFTPSDFSCTVCFTLSPGDFGSVGSSLAAIKLLGAKKIGVPYIDVPAGASLVPLVGGLAAPLGGKTVGAIPIAPTAADVTPQAAAEGAAQPDAIIDGLTTELFSKFIHSYRQQGFNTPILPSGGVYDAQGVQTQLSGVNSNIYIVAEYNYSSPAYQQFLNDKQKYDASYGNHDDEVLRGYLAAKLFAYAAGHAASMTRDGILAEMKSLNAYSTGGLLPPVNYSTPQTEFGGKAPAVYTSWVWLYKYDNGKLDPVGSNQAVDVFTGAFVSS
ncbi:MAG: ABC transporter substrate-binding protein [Acidimicrobiales bacterium]|nr:ABC transporter substrate-binding protein [Acidimicrobiales bacterium]